MTCDSAQRSSVQRLVEIGFIRVGEWKLEAGNSDLTLSCALGDEFGYKANVLYAFVVSDEVLYIGKSVRTLRKRLDGVLNPGKSQKTNYRNNSNLLDLLADGKTVEIYEFADNNLFSFGGFHLNLAAGLEDSLINSLRPPWNLTGGRSD